MTWKRVESKLLLSHPRIDIYEDDVLLPDGTKTKYLRFGNHPDASMAIAINAQNKILVQKEYSYPPDEWLYQFPGGALEKEESPLEGAIRELAEEAHLAGKMHPIGWMYVNNRRLASKFFVFVATDVQPASAQKDHEEVFEDYWFSVEEINQMIEQGKMTNYSFLAAWALFTNSKFYRKLAE